MSHLLQRPRDPAAAADAKVVPARNLAASRKRSRLSEWNTQHLGRFFAAQRELCEVLLGLMSPFHDYATKQIQLLANERRARELSWEFDPDGGQAASLGRGGRRSNTLSEEGLASVRRTCEELRAAYGSEGFEALLKERTDEILSMAGYRLLDDVASSEPGAFESGLPATAKLSGRRKVESLVTECRNLRAQIAHENHRLIFAVIHSGIKLPYGVQPDELVTVGVEGLFEGIDRFDVTRGTTLSTCATLWIRRRILRDCNLQGNTIQVPEDVLILSRKVNAILRSTPGATPESVAQELGLPLEKVRHALQVPIVINPSQLTNQDGDEISEDTLTTMGPESDPTAILSEVDRAEIVRVIDDILSEMNAVQRMVVSLFYGFSGGGDAAEALVHRMQQMSRCASNRRLRTLRTRVPRPAFNIEVYDQPIAR